MTLTGKAVSGNEDVLVMIDRVVGVYGAMI